MLSWASETGNRPAPVYLAGVGGALLGVAAVTPNFMRWYAITLGVALALFSIQLTIWRAAIALHDAIREGKS